jgi:hypothetical protein
MACLHAPSLDLFSSLIDGLLYGANPPFAGGCGPVQTFLHAIGDVFAQVVAGFWCKQYSDRGAHGDSKREKRDRFWPSISSAHWFSPFVQ